MINENWNVNFDVPFPKKGLDLLYLYLVVVVQAVNF